MLSAPLAGRLEVDSKECLLLLLLLILPDTYYNIHTISLDRIQINTVLTR